MKRSLRKAGVRLFICLLLNLYFPYSGEATTRMTQSSSPVFNSA
jgi:hypothetical protein